jgi:hypothetical protein
MLNKRKREARRWFQQAGYDLKAAKNHPFSCGNDSGGRKKSACHLKIKKLLKQQAYFLAAKARRKL